MSNCNQSLGCGFIAESDIIVMRGEDASHSRGGRQDTSHSEKKEKTPRITAHIAVLPVLGIAVYGDRLL
jgi:hypothetical protein